MADTRLAQDRATLAALKEQGLVPRRGIIRSSSATDYRNCPLYFLLRHRFGIRPSSSSEATALRMGSYTHWCFEAQLLGLTGEDKTKFVQNELIHSLELKGALRESTVEETTEELNTARAWQEIAWSIAPIDLDRYRVIFTEKLIGGTVPFFSSEIRGRLDALLLDTHKNELWILDWKTTSYVPWLYIQTAPMQLQPDLYRILIRACLEANLFRDLAIPDSATVAGVMHYVMQKPTIRISKKTAKSQGEVAALSEYRNRCEEWYRGTGEFSHLSEERGQKSQPINLSRLRYSSPEVPARVMNRLKDIDKACGYLPVPRFYPMNESTLLPRYAKSESDLNPYYPFYACASTRDMAKWPRIIREQSFEIHYREDDEPELDFAL